MAPDKEEKESEQDSSSNVQCLAQTNFSNSVVSCKDSSIRYRESVAGSSCTFEKKTHLLSERSPWENGHLVLKLNGHTVSKIVDSGRQHSFQGLVTPPNTCPVKCADRSVTSDCYDKTRFLTNNCKDQQHNGGLKVSKSVPLFFDCELEDGEERERGSDTRICQVTIDENSLMDAQSYKSASPAQRNLSPNEAGRSSPIPVPRPGKVQFAAGSEGRRRRSSLTEAGGDCDNSVSTTPPGPANSRVYGASPGKKRKRRRNISEGSSLSVTSVTSGTSINTYSYTAPDGGFGWVIVAASFFVNMIADGVTFSFGVMFNELEEEFGESKAVTAGVVSMFHAVPLLTGPIATWLTDRYGCRKVTIVGSILSSIGFLAAAFSHNIILLYLFFGVVAGFGLSLCYVSSIIIVAYYFDRRRSFATGISVCGTGVGTFLFAPLTECLIEYYDGWRGACIILAGSCDLSLIDTSAASNATYLKDFSWIRANLLLAGIFLKMCICGALFRDLEWTRKKRKRRLAGSDHSIASRFSANMPEIEHLRATLESGDVSVFLDCDSDSEQPRLASSLITIPTYIKNASKLPEDVLTFLANNNHAYDYIVDNFPDCLVARSVSNDLMAGDEHHQTEKRHNDEELESTGVKLKRKVSSLFKGPKGILKKKGDADGEEKPGEGQQQQQASTRPAGDSDPGRKLAKDGCKQQAEHRSTDCVEVGQQHKAGPDSPMLGGCQQTSEAQTKSRKREERKRRPDEVRHALPPHHQHLRNLRVRRQSLTYRGACLNTARYKLKASSCPDIYRNTMSTDESLDSDSEDCCEDLRQMVTSCCTLRYITLPFMIFCLSNFILYAWYDVSYVYSVDYAEFDLNFSSQSSTHILSVIGIFNTIGEIIIGWIGDQPWMSSSVLYAACMLLCGTATALIPLVSSYPVILTLAAIFGFSISANYSLTSPILVELVSLEQFSSAYGFLLAAQGVSNLIGPPFAGWLYDITHQWYLTFGLAGLFIALSGLLLVIIPLVKFCLKKKPDKTDHQDYSQIHQEPVNKRPDAESKVDTCVCEAGHKGSVDV